jgi:hypothetical protein
MKTNKSGHPSHRFTTGSSSRQQLFPIVEGGITLEEQLKEEGRRVGDDAGEVYERDSSTVPVSKVLATSFL